MWLIAIMAVSSVEHGLKRGLVWVFWGKVPKE